MAVSGIYIVQGEMTQVVMSLRRARRWNASNVQPDEQDPLLRSFADLRDVLPTVKDLADIAPSVFLMPFLDVVRSEHTSGVVTGLALSAIGKFLSYGLLDPASITAASAVEQIADAVTHARFVGTDPGSDEVVLLKILQVLRTLLLTPVGSLLSNESVCEILQSSFRICFETRLSELLRRSAEHTLMDMIQLLFTRLPTFHEDPRDPYVRKLRMRAHHMIDPAQSHPKRRKRYKYHRKERATTEGATAAVDAPCADSPSEPPKSEPVAESAIAAKNLVDVHGQLVMEDAASESESQPVSDTELGSALALSKSQPAAADADAVAVTSARPLEASAGAGGDDSDDDDGPAATDVLLKARRRVNHRGVTFSPEHSPRNGAVRDAGAAAPYGLPCVRELFRFLISLVNPSDKQNNEQMIQIGLNLLTVALEAGAVYLGSYTLLMPLVCSELARNLLQLLQTEKMAVFAATLRASFLMYEALRTHLKFQLELYLARLIEIVVSENGKTSFEQKETALEAIVQLWRIPDLVTELYLNYDCDLYCSNLFEDLSKLLSKNAFPVLGNVFSTHVLSLDALLTVVNTIEGNCHCRTMASSNQQSKTQLDGIALSEPGGRVPSQSAVCVTATDDGEKQQPRTRSGRVVDSSAQLPTHEDLIARKKRKRLLTTGTELFNQHPSKGVAFLQEHGVFASDSLRPEEVATWLRENPRLDKKQIGEYISTRKNAPIFEAFVKSFNFRDVRIDDALRAFLETFRLPGEAPVINMLLEHFASHWCTLNDDPFAHVDAAFTLAFAVIMLNTDQHNHNAKKQNVPMTVADFKRNLSRVNGGEDFDGELLEDIYWAVHENEIIMPDEQIGKIREDYVWKVMLLRSATKEGVFVRAPSGVFDHDLFSLVWGPTVAALSYMLDKSTDDAVIQKALTGFRKCAAIAAHYGMSDVFDNMVFSLCKFSNIVNCAGGADQLALTLAQNVKAQLAAKAMFQLVHLYGDIMRESWKNVLECVLQLYWAKLLPASMTEAEDFLDPKGWVCIMMERPATKDRREDAGLFSSVFSYLGGASSDSRDGRGPSADDLELLKISRTVIEECHPEQLVTDSRYLTDESLSAFWRSLVGVSTQCLQAESFDDVRQYAIVFLLEFLVSMALENKDRLIPHWANIKAHLFRLLTTPSADLVVERTVISLIRLVSRLLCREDQQEEVLQSLSLLLPLPMATLRRLSTQIAYGLHQLLRTNAANIHTRDEWRLLFVLLEVAGAAAFPRDGQLRRDREVADAPQSIPISDVDSDRGYTSDSEVYDVARRHSKSAHTVALSETKGGSAEWTFVEHSDGDVTASSGVATPQDEDGAPSPMSWAASMDQKLTLRTDLQLHNAQAFLKCCETLAFLVRDTAHITPENFESCVHCLRTFVEAVANGGRYERMDAPSSQMASGGGKNKPKARHTKPSGPAKADATAGKVNADSRLDDSYHQTALQLLDLAHTLHVKAADIFGKWKSALPQLDTGAVAMWSKCWCPLLQILARLCCDTRRPVRMAALNYLPRALLIPDLHALTPELWEQCFGVVLFPLLTKLLEGFAPLDAAGSEEARVRAVAVVCKVFLQHLSPLLSSPHFGDLWAKLLDLLGQFYFCDKGDLLLEAIPESLKNLLLVMDTAGTFASLPNLYALTRDHLQPYLPALMAEIFPHGCQNCPSAGKPCINNVQISNNNGTAPAELEEVVVQTVGGTGRRGGTTTEDGKLQSSPRPESPKLYADPQSANNSQVTVVLHPPTHYLDAGHEQTFVLFPSSSAVPQVATEPSEMPTDSLQHTD